MNHKFLRGIAALLTALTMCLVGCAGEEAGRADSADPISLTDAAGCSFTLEEPARRIVSGYYVSTYAMLALGEAERLVGIEKKAYARPVYLMARPELLELPSVGTMKECSVETIASLEPDLVLLPKKLSEYAETLRSLGIPVLTVSPESDEELSEMLTMIGRACGAEERADALIGYREGKTAFLAGILEGADAPSVIFCGNSSYLTAAPGGMYQSSLIESAGGVNAAAELDGDYWTEISYETFLRWNPDAVILPAGAAYSVEEFCADEVLASLSAVKNGRVYAMPSGIEEWDSPIPSGILGALWLASVLHPDRYSAADFSADATAFYDVFYGFTPDPVLWN